MDELEAKLNQIADNLLVQTTLVERFERRTEERFAEHEQRMDRVETALENLANGYVNLQAAMRALVEHVETLTERVETLADGYQNLQAALSGLTEQIDRFLRGQQGDGRH
jgi:chromosome segregation ATPase